MDCSVDLLPLGSVVWTGGQKRLMVIARALVLTTDDESAYFDYGGCLYPEGLIGETVFYFNAADVQEVVVEGYEDEENRAYVAEVADSLRNVDLPRGDTERFRKRAAAASQANSVDRP